jgi:methylthioribose-1-phosphate isomerase
MNVDGKPYRTIWPSDDGSVEVIDQAKLPHEFVVRTLTSAAEAADAIASMVVRGAPLIGATAAYGVYLGLRDNPSEEGLESACRVLLATRPTGANLQWAIDRVRGAVAPLPQADRAQAAFAEAARICDEDVEQNRAIGAHGLKLIADLDARRRSSGPAVVNILTHCNAGWLATVDLGTALAPVYMAHDTGIPVHVWVSETRPRSQGARLTAWELGQHGVPHTVVVDSAAGHLLQRGLVDCCWVGTDRTAANGDVANKIGTYPLALAAHDNGVPFYVALPGPTIDFSLADGLREIPIEQRSADEVATVSGRTPRDGLAAVTITPASSAICNYAFDVTPARLVTALITERGVCEASLVGLAALYPERVARMGSSSEPALGAPAQPRSAS